MNYLSGVAASNPAILWLACRWLERGGSCTLTEINQALRPSAIVEGQGDQLRDSLDVGKDIGIIEFKEETKQYTLVPGYPDCSFASYKGFKAYLRSSLLDKAVNEIATDVRPSDVALGLAWLSTLDPLVPLGWTWNDGVEELVNNTGKMRSVISNQTQWTSFKRWAIALGMGYEIKIAKNVKFQADPTEAILEVIGQHGRLKISAAEFIKLLSTKIPCLFPGPIMAYLKNLDVELSSRGDSSIGLQMGYVLEKLNKRGFITLKAADDSRDRVSYTWANREKTFDFVEFGEN
ncbi:hypothetical protein N8373_00315 [Gammaproteobacteria bacterium]|nr:hypothetical protein [Gammaproteobacteria bacterium]